MALGAAQRNTADRYQYRIARAFIQSRFKRAQRYRNAAVDLAIVRFDWCVHDVLPQEECVDPGTHHAGVERNVDLLLSQRCEKFGDAFWGVSWISIKTSCPILDV